MSRTCLAPWRRGLPECGRFFTSDRRVRTSVPRGTRDAWSRCLITALADVVAHRDLKSWTDLLTLPALVLPASLRGGRRHVLRHEGEVRRRCLDWLSGIPDLWTPSHVRAGKHRAPTSCPPPPSPGLPLSSRRVPSAEPVRLFCRIPRFSPLKMLLTHSASSTLTLLLGTVST